MKNFLFQMFFTMGLIFAQTATAQHNVLTDDVEVRFFFKFDSQIDVLYTDTAPDPIIIKAANYAARHFRVFDGAYQDFVEIKGVEAEFDTFSSSFIPIDRSTAVYKILAWDIPEEYAHLDMYAEFAVVKKRDDVWSRDNLVPVKMQRGKNGTRRSIVIAAVGKDGTLPPLINHRRRKGDDLYVTFCKKHESIYNYGDPNWTLRGLNKRTNELLTNGANGGSDYMTDWYTYQTQNDSCGGKAKLPTKGSVRWEIRIKIQGRVDKNEYAGMYLLNRRIFDDGSVSWDREAYTPLAFYGNNQNLAVGMLLVGVNNPVILYPPR